MGSNSRKPNYNRVAPSKRILILCEGQSEQIYINGYKSEEVNKRRLAKVDVEIYQPKDYSPHGLLTEAKKKAKEAKKDKMPYESVWIVFDRDGHANVPQTFEEAPIAKINIAFSSVCFEVWILFHFERTSRYFENCDEILSYIKRNDYLAYAKTNYYNQLTEEHKKTAVANAEWLYKQHKNDIDRGMFLYELNPFTNFDMLIKYLHEIE